MKITTILEPGKPAVKMHFCSTCVCNSPCLFENFVTSFEQKKLFFGAKLLCCLKKTEYLIENAFSVSENIDFSFLRTRKTELCKMFLPQIKILWDAFCGFDSHYANENEKRLIIVNLFEFLEWYDLTDFFETTYNDNITALYEIEILNLQKEIDFLTADGPVKIEL